MKVFALILTLVLGAMSQTFASNVADAPRQQMEFKKPENEIIGKITSIDANKVVIQVATRNEMKKPENIKQNKEDFDKKKFDNNNKGKINEDEFFTLIGETKTINISQATFGGMPSGMPPEFKSNNNQQPKDQKGNAKPPEMKEKTYADYKVGDYISIECTDSTYTTAKSVRDSRLGFTLLK